MVGVLETGDPVGGGGEQDPLSGVAGGDAEGDRNVGFPGAWWAKEDDVAGFGEVVACGQRGDVVAADSGLVVDESNRDDIGVIFGSGGGGPYLLMENLEKWHASGARTVSPFFIANMLPDTASGQIAIETGIRGSNMCIVTACSTGTVTCCSPSCEGCVTRGSM